MTTTSSLNQRRVIRAVKRFCPDFRPVRHALGMLGASFRRNCWQIDYVFLVPGNESRRIKLRVEDERQSVYLYDKGQPESSPNEFQFFELNDPQIKEILVTILPTRAVVRKEREEWQDGNAVFHLDTIEGIGRVFEIELISPDQNNNPGIDFYEKHLEPLLGEAIRVSNEDLLAPKRTQGGASDPDG